MISVYGLRQCDTCRKTLKYLREHGLKHVFIDLREQRLERGRIERWVAEVGSERLVNRRSATWRGLDDADRARAAGPALVDLLAAHPTLIKRPLVERGGKVTLGFQPEAWT